MASRFTCCPASVNNDLIVAPARHPAITLWRELNRASYPLTQPQLFGGVERWPSGTPSGRQPSGGSRYTVPTRAATGALPPWSRCWGSRLMMRGWSGRAPAITHGSELSWSKPAPPTPPAPLTPDPDHHPPHPRHHHPRPPAHHREGNLHLTAIDPRHHHPPRPRRRLDRHHHHSSPNSPPPAPSPPSPPSPNSAGTTTAPPDHVTLPPEAEAHIDPHPPPPHHLARPHHSPPPGHPAWLLDETITPRPPPTHPNPTNLPPLRVLAQNSPTPTAPHRPPHPRTPPHTPRPRTPRTPRLRHPPPRHPPRPRLDRPPPHHPRDLALLLTEHNLARQTPPHHHHPQPPHPPNPSPPTSPNSPPTHLTTDHTPDTADQPTGQRADQVASEARLPRLARPCRRSDSRRREPAGLPAHRPGGVQRANASATGSGPLAAALDTRRLAAMLADADR